MRKARGSFGEGKDVKQATDPALRKLTSDGGQGRAWEPQAEWNMLALQPGVAEVGRRNNL